MRRLGLRSLEDLCFGLHCGEEQYVSDRRAVGKQHNESVDTEAKTACGRHTVLKCGNVIVVNLCRRIGIFSLLLCNLIFKSLALVDRIVKLGECVTHLGAVDEILKSLGKCGIGRLSLRQGRVLYGIIVDEGGLNKLILYEGVEQLYENCALVASAGTST